MSLNNEDPSSRKWQGQGSTLLHFPNRSIEAVVNYMYLPSPPSSEANVSFLLALSSRTRSSRSVDEAEMVGILREEVHAYMPRMKAIHSSLLVVWNELR